MRQTVTNLKGDLGPYIAKLYAKNPKASPQIVKKGNRALKAKDPQTGKSIDAAGVYRPGIDTLHVAEGQIENALTHEIGHQIMAIEGEHLVPMLGRTRANAFRKEIKAAFRSAQKREAKEFLPGVKQAGSITDYAMSNIEEYMAEGFKWAQQAPHVFEGVDDELLRIMQKYLVTDKPTSFDAMLYRRGGQ
jgi:Mlc titration factor MtfA (ptsG expression regulator)